MQPSLKVIIETKRGTDARLDQLKEHLKAFGNEDTQVLLLLMSGEPGETFREDLRVAVRDFNVSREHEVIDICTTFSEIIQSVGNTLAEHDYEMQDLL